MGSLRRVVSRVLGYADPSEAYNVNVSAEATPGRFARGMGMRLDQKRATFLEWPILWFATAYLWHRGFVTADESRSFGLTDYIWVTFISFVIKRLAVNSRWQGGFRWD